MDTLLQDIRYGFRMLFKAPTFVAIAALTLALGIGANTALFSIISGVLLSPLPFRQPEQLIALYSHNKDFSRASISYPDFLDWSHNDRSFSDLAAFRQESLLSFDDQMVLYNPEAMTGIISDSLASRRFSMILLGGFAALALVLSAIGIYGVISYLAAQRTQEIGIRMALGAQRTQVLGMVLGQGLRVSAIGVAIGLSAALVLARLIANLLYGVKPHDPLTFAGVAALLTLVALGASYLPALRATRVDPVTALRYE